MPIFNNILAGSSGQGDTGYEIERSVVFSDSNAYYNRTPSGAGNRKTWTWSCWVKHSTVASDYWENLFGAFTDTNNYAYIVIEDDVLRFFDYQSGSAVASTSTSEPKYRDPGAWQHFVIVLDTTQATDTNRLKFYINGEQLTLPASVTYPSQNDDGLINSAINHRIAGNINGEFDGYLAEMHFIDGTALDASSFGETNADTNQWIPKQYSGSYGTNGFYLDFATRATDPIDASGNGNNWSSSNVVATDWRIDTPTNNFATMNPLDDPNSRASGSTFSEGNLKVSEVGGNARFTMIGNFGMSSGKWYFEFCGVNSDNTFMLGIGDITKALSRGYTGTSGDGLFIYVDGDTYTGSTNASYGTSWTYGDVMGIAVDMDNNALYFAKNNTWMNSGDPTSGSSKTGAAFTTELAGKTWAACMGRGSTSNTITGTFNFGQDSSFAGAKTSQGNGPDGTDLYYDPPSGYIPMCTAQMDDPSIADPTEYFSAVTWSGDGTSSRSITSGVDADWVWYKDRTGTESHSLYDSIRGAQKRLISNSTDIERTRSGGLQSFDSTGFTVGSDTECNGSGKNYVGWTWKAGGTASSNTDGSITSSVSANTTAGFSIVSWTGNGTNGATVGHGLSQAPELIITKNRDDVYSWQTVSTELTSKEYLMYLNTTDAEFTTSAFVGYTWNDSVITFPSTGYYGTFNVSGDKYIGYAFHSVDGYSKVGKYAGNGAQDGAFVYTGFRPAFIFIKRITSSGSNSYIVDNKRIGYNNFVYLTDAGSNKYLWPDSNAAEGNGNTTKGIGMDILSNGFKFRTSGGDYNGSGSDYLFYAIAESPFKYSNAR